MTAERQKAELVERLLQLTDRVFRELLPIIPKEVLQIDLTYASTQGGSAYLHEWANADE